MTFGQAEWLIVIIYVCFGRYLIKIQNIMIVVNERNVVILYENYVFGFIFFQQKLNESVEVSIWKKLIKMYSFTSVGSRYSSS